MALYRQVYISFWEDTKVTDDFTAEDKYFMLYLLTNNKTNLIGCYEISAKQIAYDMGYSVDCIRNLLDRFEKIHKIIVYNLENKEILIKNWGKYNWNTSPKLESALIKGVESVKTDQFREWLKSVVTSNKLIPYAYPIDTVCEKKAYPMDTTVTVTDTDTVSDSDIKENTESHFSAFWESYPRKESKEKTKQWFMKNKPSEELQSKILEALERFKKTEQWQDKQFIPHPTTWLNQKRWEDEVIIGGSQKPNGKKVAKLPDWYDKYEKDLKNQPKPQPLSEEESKKVIEEAEKRFNGEVNG